MRRAKLVFIVGLLSASLCHGQNQQSLGDYARQIRAQKQQREAQENGAATNVGPDSSGQDSSASNTSTSKTARVITNDDSPGSQDLSPVMSKGSNRTLAEPADSATKHTALGERWKSQIRSQKDRIASLQGEIAQLSSSIHYAGSNCLANCAKWNRRQEQKQGQIDNLKAQLAQQQHRLEDMQETARKQGFGNAVYDP